MCKDGEGEKNWADAVLEIRVIKLIKRYKEANKDIIVGLMLNSYDRFYQEIVEQDQLELLPSFVQQVFFAFLAISIKAWQLVDFSLQICPELNVEVLKTVI